MTSSISNNFPCKFKEMVVMWIVGTFERHGVFDTSTGDTPILVRLKQYYPHYIPEGFKQITVTEQTTWIRYEYSRADDKKLIVLISTPDTRIYLNIDQVDLEDIELDGYVGLYFEKNNQRYVIINKYGYSIIVYGAVSKDDLITIVNSIQSSANK